MCDMLAHEDDVELLISSMGKLVDVLMRSDLNRENGTITALTITHRAMKLKQRIRVTCFEQCWST